MNFKRFRFGKEFIVITCLELTKGSTAFDGFLTAGDMIGAQIT